MSLAEELYAWMSGLAAWQRDLGRRLLATPKLDDHELDEALRVLLDAHGALEANETAQAPQPPAPGALAPVTSTTTAPRLLTLGGLRGVGAVASDQELRFLKDGLTIVYGPNATGKTSYVRALKRICRTVDCDSNVLADVFAAPADVPEGHIARLETSGPGGAFERRVDLTTDGEAELTAISVFDARCAELYVNDRNDIAYVPSALRLLTRMVSTQERLRSLVSQRINDLEHNRPDFSGLPEGSKAKHGALGLSAMTKPRQVEAFCQLSDTEQSRLNELRGAVAADAGAETSKTAASARRDAGQADDLRVRLKELGSLVNAPATNSLATLTRDARSASEAVKLAAEQFSCEPVAGVGGEPWQRLWEAARGFWAAHPRHSEFPPTAGDHCPLCLQELGDVAADRMHHFESHVRSEVQRQADEAKAKFDAALIRLDNDTVAQARGPLLDALHDTEPELHAVIDAYLKVGEQRMTALRTDPAAVATLGPLPDSPSDQLERWAQKRRQHAMTLENMSDVEQEKAIRAELGELEGRQQLGERLPEVQRWVASLARIERLRVAHSELHTGKVTRKQSELSKTAVTDALDSRLDHELAALRCDHIPLDPRFRGSAGSTVVNLELVGARSAPELRAVLSEGEQRAVALAFFFAEVACAEHDGGIVLDDPVSSLDDERREYIARRLVEEAARRQVIVFTHDLPFMLDLVQQAEQANIDQSQQAVWRDQRVAGLVDNQPPFDAMNLRQRVAALAIEVQEWDKESRPANQDDAWRRVCDVYRRMRTAWERAVEERLLAGVVQRFQRPVHTQKLDKVQITEELLKAVNDGMDRCSQYVHDAPVGARGGLPSRQQIAADLEPLRTFEKDSRL